MIIRPTRHLGLQAIAALLLLLTGVAIWLGGTMPDPKSCVAVAAQSLKNPDNADLRARTDRACKRPRSS